MFEYEKTPICWLSNFYNLNDSCPVVGWCHIIDKCLLEKGDMRLVDRNNQIRLCSTIHQIWDSRDLIINPDGTITTKLTDTQLQSIGLQRESRLPECVLNEKRREYLSQRENDWNAFLIQRHQKDCERL